MITLVILKREIPYNLHESWYYLNAFGNVVLDSVLSKNSNILSILQFTIQEFEKKRVPNRKQDSPQQPINSNNNQARHFLMTSIVKEEISKISWKDAQQVNLNLSAFHVVFPQHFGIFHHNSLVQISLMSPVKRELIKI